jgi:hypothetical protein
MLVAFIAVGAAAVGVSRSWSDNPSSEVPAAKRALIEPPPPVTDLPTRTAGVDFDVHDGPFGSSTFTIEDTFQGPVGETWYVVFAGQKNSADTGVGTLRIYSGPADISDGLANTLEGDYEVPGSSDLKIMAESNGVLSLIDEVSRDSFAFDLRTLSFSS